MMKLAMEATYEDPDAGSCSYTLRVETEVPPEAGTWDQPSVQQVFEQYVSFLLRYMEAATFQFFVDDEVVE